MSKSKYTLFIGMAVVLFTLTYINNAVQNVYISRSKIYTFHDVKVLRAYDNDTYAFQNSNGEVTVANICGDYIPPDFVPGLRLRELIVKDEGDCWSLDPNKHAGYFKMRDINGQPIIDK